jgi:hypothetical protein
MCSHLHGTPLPLILRATFCLIFNGNYLAAQLLSTGTLIINGFGSLGVVGMFFIHGGSSTWNPLLFAASVD